MNLRSSPQLALRLVACLAAAVLASSGCDDQPTTALVVNGYPSPAGGDAAVDTITVWKVWWVTTLFPDPVPAGAVSQTERTVPGTDLAYALLAPGWSPDAGAPPPRLIAVRSVQPFTATAHNVLVIAVSDDRFSGNCAAGSTLGAEDARLIVERIFPDDFAGMSYDPATCTTAPQPADAAAAND